MAVRNWFYVPLVVLLLWLAWYFKVIIGYVLIAGVLSLIGQPLIGFLNRVELRGHRLPPSVAAMVTICSILGMIVGVAAMFIPLLAHEARRLSGLSPEDVIRGIQVPVQSVQQFVDRFSIGTDTVNVEQILKSQLTDLFDVDAVAGSLSYAVGVTGDVFIGFFAVCFITFFFLKDRQLLRSIIMILVPSGHEERAGKVLHKSKELLTRYFIGILIEMAIVMTVIAIGLSILGVRNAMLIGFVGGLFNIIPYVGPMIGAALGIAIGVATNSEGLMMSGLMALMGKMALVYAVAQLLDNILLQPMIYSQSVKAHPLEIFIIIIMAGNVAGILGMIVAVPTYSIFRVFAGEFLLQFKVFRSLSDSR
ncbi:MAG: AI-2E family transporter [Flavobacteriales bacterium]|nr:AI-2E family transporter [Flavobacteriales bacterium]